VSHRSTANRVGLGIVGLVLTVAGAAALARGLGLLGAPHAPVISGQVAAYAARNAWFWPALAIVALVIELLALRWLLGQARTDTIRHLDLETDTRHGATRLSARAAASALEDDASESMHGGQPTYRGRLTPGHRATSGRGPRATRGERVRATLNGAPSAPGLAVAVVLPDEADPAAARHDIQGAVTRLRQSLETERLPAVVRLHTVRTHF
jgi:hypothetical protein